MVKRNETWAPNTKSMQNENGQTGRVMETAFSCDLFVRPNDFVCFMCQLLIIRALSRAPALSPALHPAFYCWRWCLYCISHFTHIYTRAAANVVDSIWPRQRSFLFIANTVPGSTCHVYNNTCHAIAIPCHSIHTPWPGPEPSVVLPMANMCIYIIITISYYYSMRFSRFYFNTRIRMPSYKCSSSAGNERQIIH